MPDDGIVADMTSIASTVTKILTEGHAKLYQLAGGKLLGGGEKPASVIVVTTTGRKTGKKRSKPLAHLRDGDNYLVTGSAAGADEHPAWILNMMADPNVTVQDLDEIIECTASVELDGPRRDELYDRFKQYGSFAGYEAKTDRTIPVAVLTPK